MNPNLRTALMAAVWIGVLAVYGIENTSHSSRQPHPPTTRPPVTSNPGAKPSTPPSFAEKPSRRFKETPIQDVKPVPNGRQGYIVFAAVALLLLRKTETS